MSFSINFDPDAYNKAIECLSKKTVISNTAVYNPETNWITLGNDDKISDEELANMPAPPPPDTTYPTIGDWSDENIKVHINGQNHPIWIRNTSSTSANVAFQYVGEESYGTATAPASFKIKKDTGATAWTHEDVMVQPNGPVRTATYNDTAGTPGIQWYVDRTFDTGSVAYCWDRTMHVNYSPEKAAKEQKQLEKANKKSFELLKDWLSPAEYNYLMEQGSLELPSQYEKDTIYIVNKDPMRRIGIKKKGKIIEKSLCIHASHSYADGDVLLANILLLKTDEKKFLDIANVHDFYA